MLDCLPAAPGATAGINLEVFDKYVLETDLEGDEPKFAIYKEILSITPITPSADRPTSHFLFL